MEEDEVEEEWRNCRVAVTTSFLQRLLRVSQSSHRVLGILHVQVSVKLDPAHSHLSEAAMGCGGEQRGSVTLGDTDYIGDLALLGLPLNTLLPICTIPTPRPPDTGVMGFGE